MSSQDEDGMSLDKGSGNFGVVLIKPKLSYSRELLLSLSNLDSCKRLPSGFDESLKSDLEDALMRIPDRPRIPGSLPFHGFRRNEFGASPPTRVDAGTYSKGNYGKWESRSSMRGDRDRDSQSDKDSGITYVLYKGICNMRPGQIILHVLVNKRLMATTGRAFTISLLYTLSLDLV
ncbi:hypothetical protein OROGR_020658 [Orobanche gracilis]